MPAYTLNELENNLIPLIHDPLKTTEIYAYYKKLRKENPGFPKLKIKKNLNDLSKHKTIINQILTHYAYILFKKELANNPHEKMELEKKFLSYIYDKNSELFYQLILSENDKKTDNVGFSYPDKIIYNLDGYDEGMTLNPPSIASYGSGLSLNSDTPISYVINKPIGEVKGIIVKVYGGFTMQDRRKRLAQPTVMVSKEDQALLREGIAVVYLNLVDLLKSNIYQNNMPELLHDEIHASIHRFYEILSRYPDYFDPALADFKGKPICLSGASWGGRTAIRHAELYPHTFNGYISIDGSISGDMVTQADRAYVRGRDPLLSYLNPVLHMEEIKDPILLVHNENDNNVNIMVSLDFYNQARQKGLDSLIGVLFNSKGNPIYTHEIHNTGHFSPAPDTDAFATQMKKIASFIQNELKVVPEVSKWRAQVNNIKAQVNYVGSTPEALFIAEMFRRTIEGKVDITENDQAKVYATFSFLKEADSSTIKQYIMDHVNYENYKNALLFQLKSIILFSEELTGYQFSKIDDEFVTPELVQSYIDLIQTSEITSDNYLLYLSLFMANPPLQEDLYQQAKGIPVFRDELEDAKKTLNKEIAAHQALTQQVLQKAYQALKQRNKEISEKIIAGDIQTFNSWMQTFANKDPKQRFFSFTEIYFKLSDELKVEYLLLGILNHDFSKEDVEKLIKVIKDKAPILLKKKVEELKKMEIKELKKETLESLCCLMKEMDPEDRKQILTIAFFQAIKESALLEIVFQGLSSDEVFTLFSKVDGKNTALSDITRTALHDVGFLKILENKIGEERFKRLIHFPINETTNATILSCYVNELAAFEYLIGKLTEEELLQNIKDSKHFLYGNSSIVTLLASTQGAHNDHATILLELFDKIDSAKETSSLLFEFDGYGESAFYFMCSGALSVGEYTWILEYCDKAELRKYLENINLKKTGLLSLLKDKNKEGFLTALEQKLGKEEWYSLLRYHLKQSLLFDPNASQYLRCIFQNKTNAEKKEILGIAELQGIKSGDLLEIVTEGFSPDEIFALFSQREGTNTPLSNVHRTALHDVTFLKALEQKMGEEKFKRLIHFSINETTKATILSCYVNELEAFEYLMSKLTKEELLENIKDSKHFLTGYSNIMMLLAGEQGSHNDYIEIMLKLLEKMDSVEEATALLFEIDSYGESAFYFICGSKVPPEVYLKILTYCDKITLKEHLEKIDPKKSGLLDIFQSSERESRLAALEQILGEDTVRKITEQKLGQALHSSEESAKHQQTRKPAPLVFLKEEGEGQEKNTASTKEGKLTENVKKLKK